MGYNLDMIYSRVMGIHSPGNEETGAVSIIPLFPESAWRAAVPLDSRWMMPALVSFHSCTGVHSSTGTGDAGEPSNCLTGERAKRRRGCAIVVRDENNKAHWFASYSIQVDELQGRSFIISNDDWLLPSCFLLHLYSKCEMEMQCHVG